METLQINYQPSIKEKLMTFLNSFDSNEVEIVKDNNSFETTKKRVNESYRKLKNKETVMYSFEEVDAFLEKSISEYES